MFIAFAGWSFGVMEVFKLNSTVECLTQRRREAESEEKDPKSGGKVKAMAGRGTRISFTLP
jgi:hypothetical protein